MNTQAHTRTLESSLQCNLRARHRQSKCSHDHAHGMRRDLGQRSRSRARGDPTAAPPPGSCGQHGGRQGHSWPACTAQPPGSESQPLVHRREPWLQATGEQPLALALPPRVEKGQAKRPHRLLRDQCRRRATPRYPPQSAWNLHLVSRRAAVPAASAALPPACASPEVLWAQSQDRGPGPHAVAQHHEKARRAASLPSRQSTRSSRGAGVAPAPRDRPR